MSSPRLLLVDEASLGLSPIMTETVFDLIADVRTAAGTAVLLVEQNVAALDLADRAFVLEQGQVVDRAEGDDGAHDAAPAPRRVPRPHAAPGRRAHADSDSAPIRPPQGGSFVKQPPVTGVSSSGSRRLVAAAIVGIVGYLKLSLEPSLNHQLPYLASAGMALILLSVIGASLIVTDQLHADDTRMEELAAAIERLADSVAADVERPARRTS